MLSLMPSTTRSEQPAFELFSQVDQLFLKSVEKQDVTDKLKMVEKHFKNDYDEESLIDHQNYFDKRSSLCNTREIFFDVKKNKNMAALENVAKKT